MRRPFVAGNWKMNLLQESSAALVRSLVDAGPPEGVDVAVFPPFVYLPTAIEAARGSSIGVGAQNIYHESSGAFTGEVSGEMVRDLGGQLVILGHSERRNVLGETNVDVNRKLKSALSIGLTPIVCVGELLEQREAGQTLTVIREQFQGSFDGLDANQFAHCVIAYEPVWAIGTGQVATPQQAEEVHATLREVMAGSFGQDAADAVRIQYGGSVKPDNAADLMSQPNIDGALVGGASLKADSFLAIVNAASTCKTA